MSDNHPKVSFDSSLVCCTSIWYRSNCTQGKTGYCSKCSSHYCNYHWPVNNTGVSGGHVCK